MEAISNFILDKNESPTKLSNHSLEQEVSSHALISLEGLPIYCPIKAGLFWGSIVLVCIVAIAISVSAQIDLVYSSFWVLFSAMATFLFLTKNRPQHLSIYFTENDVTIFCGDKKMATNPLSSVKTECSCWINEDDIALPALKIKSPKLKSLSIGLTVENDEWLSYWNTMKQPDVFISDLKDWKKLTSLLQCE